MVVNLTAGMGGDTGTMAGATAQDVAKKEVARPFSLGGNQLLIDFTAGAK